MSQSQTNIDAESPDASMSQSQKSAIATTNLTRRQAMRGMIGGAAAVGAGSAGLRLGSEDVEAAVPVGIGIAAGAGWAASYAVRNLDDYFTGNDVDAEKYADLAYEEVHNRVLEDAISMRAADDSVLTNLNNLLNNAENAAFSNAKYAAIEQMNLGNTLAETKDAAYDEIDSFFATQQENLIEHQALQHVKIDNMSSQIIEAHPEDENQHYDVIDWSNSNYTEFISDSVELFDGRTYHYEYLRADYGNGSYVEAPYGTVAVDDSGDTDDDLSEMYIKPVDDSGSSELFYDHDDYLQVANKIEDQHTQVTDEITTWADGVYDSYTEGDIELSDLVNAGDIADMAPDESGFSYAGADLAILGVEGGDHSYEIDLKDSETVVQGTIYAQGRSEPLDLNTVYSPGTIDGTVWLAYETYDENGELESDLVGLEQDFELLSAVDSDGNNVEEVTFSSKNQQTTDTDLEEITNQLQELQELQNELQAQQQQEVFGGGGGLFGGGGFLEGTNSTILIVVAAGLAAVGLLNN